MNRDGQRVIKPAGRLNQDQAASSMRRQGEMKFNEAFERAAATFLALAQQCSNGGPPQAIIPD
jgi:hypothetical protein